MYKTIIFIIIIISGTLIFYNKIIFSFLKNNNTLVHIKDDNPNYKNNPVDKKGDEFVGDNLKIYKVTREKLLPLDNHKEQVIENKKNIDINDSNDQKTDSSEVIQSKIKENIYLQLASFKTKKKAKLFIKNYKMPSNLKDNKLTFNIISADIENKGTYYRIRIGPYKNLNDVYKLCFDLNINNNECLIIKNK